MNKMEIMSFAGKWVALEFIMWVREAKLKNSNTVFFTYMWSLDLK
jgi:hypothetical protein